MNTAAVTARPYQRLDQGRLGVMQLQRGVAGAPRVVCFPFAGGGPLAFQRLAQHLPASFSVWAIDPPGHVRTQGAPLATVAQMAALYLRELAALLEGAVLLGHSLGGYVALALAAAFEARSRPCPALLVGAALPPHLRDPARPLTHMTDEQLFCWVRDLGGLPAEGLDQRELFDLYRHAIRADCTAFEAFEPPPALVATPLCALAGASDPIAPSPSMGEWRRYAAAVETGELTGGHLFVVDNPRAVAVRLISMLPRAMGHGPSKE